MKIAQSRDKAILPDNLEVLHWYCKFMKSLSDKYWSLPAPFRAEEEERRLAGDFGVTPEIIRLLNNRGIDGREAIRRHLYPTLADLEPPRGMKGLAEACEILCAAITAGDDIVIWGDYDVDGISATSMLVTFFRLLGVDVQWFVPDRFTDGYGLSIPALQTLLVPYGGTAPVLVTVDCGINSHEEVGFAKRAGCRVIITDHHLPDGSVPPADAVINPKQEGCSFANKELAGVGVAFYLALAVRGALKDSGFFERSGEVPNIKSLLQFVALGTVADMVPLAGDNRVLVKAGFEVLNTEPGPGIAALMEESDIRSQTLTSEDVAFQLAPRINAAGRLDSASLAVELLIEENREKALLRARKLSALNDRRKELCRLGLEETLDSASMYPDIGRKSCVVLSGQSIGILGVVASQLVDRLRCPVVILSRARDKKHGEVLKGSCRSVPGVDIFAVLQRCQESLLQFGGHAMAAGVTLREEHFEQFRHTFEKVVGQSQSRATEPLRVDLVLPIEEVLSVRFSRGLQLLEPFGPGNEKPVFCDRDVIIQEIKRMGRNGDHLSFFKRGRFEKSRCVAFRFGHHMEAMRARKTFDLVYSPMLSRFRNAEKWQARLVDLI